MFEATQKALEAITVYMKEQNVTSAMRIALLDGGWSGPSLGLALDEPKKTDERFDRDGVTFVIDKQLYEETKPITLDCVEMRRFKRFTIKSALDDKIDCGSCNC